MFHQVNLIEHHCREHGSFWKSYGVNFKEALVTQGPSSLHMVNAMERKRKQVAERGALMFLKTNTVGVF